MKKNQLVVENKMGTADVPKLLFTMALPIAFSMLVEAFYNVVDSIFVSRVSEAAFTALSLAFPFQNLMIAVGVGTAVGVNSLVSKRLGEKNPEKANITAENGIFLALLSYIFFALLAFFGARPFLESQTANPEIIEHGITYIRIVGVGSFGLMTQLIYEKLLQSTGKTSYILLIQGLGAVINIILDPIMIFGYFGFPKMGVAGAALATIIGQTAGGIVAIYINHAKNTELTIKYRGFKPNGSIIKEIYAIGIPSIIMSSIGSVMVYFFNRILLVESEAAAAVLGAYYKLQSFIFMPVFGVTNALIPIAAYNYGAKNKKRVISVHRWGTVYAVSIMAIGTLIFQIFGEEILGLFALSTDTVSMGVVALRVISIAFVLAGFNIVGSSFFQALGNGILSMIMSIVRQLVVILPVAQLLLNFGTVNTTWWAFPIAEVVAFFICAAFLAYFYRLKIQDLPDEPPVYTSEFVEYSE